ncbi:MAG: tripartite tricarboxylate transporter substrate binding protein [Candidatus Accumulibacter sp.]|jgi:tripartite-type tricarboxylate transporter receptor subunit TctC|nr:tripartite tricarboxylate transporter substrate binding protein [Accumulibacter sp.]
MNKLEFAGIALLSAAAVFSTGACAQEWQPDSTIEIIAPANPGGGWDLTARAIQRTLTEGKLVKKNVIVSNKPGGGGATGWTYLKGKEKNGNFLAANSSLLLLNNLLGSSPLSYKDFTPLAMLTTDWIGIAVKADAPYKSGIELLEALKKNPGALTIGVGPAMGNNDHLSFIQIARKFGVDTSKLKWVVYEGAGGDILMSLLGGHIGIATVSVPEMLTQHKAGKVRILGITSDKRMELLPDVPTWKEQGIDIVFPHWRGIQLPPGMTPAQIAYWDKVMAEVARSESFKKTIESLNGQVYYKNSAEFTKFLEEQTAILGPLTVELGLVKK